MIRIDPRHRREIADVAADDPEESGNRSLVGCDTVDVADVDGPPLVRMVADF
jgi:hypothetical protein